MIAKRKPKPRKDGTRLYLATNLREVSEAEAKILFSAGNKNLGRLIRGIEIDEP